MRSKPLVSRVYKYKNPASTFFCPLCRSERGITISPRLTNKNYVQILLTSIVLGSFLFPFIGVKCFFIFFVSWGVFELAVRTDYKKQIACPHCGFDAAWYKRDVKVARQIVKDFWLQKQTLGDQKIQPVAKQS
ncbi:MAG: hypothetical protein Q7U04_00445 [Bacteriovorax sp.]|nr:hypothetical protein [Bacteriovorax sp.]